MKAVVMAGGFGTRIQPLTNSVPKPMLPILNRPMMQHIIEKLRDAGITEIVILLYFKPEVIRDYFKDGRDFGVNIHYVLPDDDYGTAGAVKFAASYLDESFIIVSGDLVTDFDLSEIIAFHKKKNAMLSITLTPVEDPLQFGVVIANQEGKIQRFLEKPSWGEVFSDTINTGIYILEPRVLNYIPEATNFDFGKDLFPLLMKERVDLWGCTVRGYWRDVGNPESYRDVQKDLLFGKVALSFRGERRNVVGGTIYIEEGASIDDSAQCDGIVVIGRNTRVEGGTVLKNVILGDRCMVRRGSQLNEVTAWNDVSIGENCTIKNSVICANNKIEKKVSIERGTIMAENCEIGAYSSFEADIVVWPDKIVEEGSIVSNNIVWGNRYKSSIFEGGTVSGRVNVELSCAMSTKLAEAFGSMLPVGSRVYLSRDYHKSSRMLKRAFLAGLLSSGINVVDIRVVPSNVARFGIKEYENIVAGVHFRQSTTNQAATEILFFNSDGLFIDTNTEKNCERIFFRENFRRVGYDEIGEISEKLNLKEKYVKNFLKLIGKEMFAARKPRVVVDLLFGSTIDVYPDILNKLGIENVVLNAYSDDKKLSRLPSLIEHSEEQVSKIVRTLGMDFGLMIFPNGQKLQLVCNNGEVLSPHNILLIVLKLLNDTATSPKKVYLPMSAPDFMDEQLPNLTIERGKMIGLKASKIKEFDLMANLQGNFAFTEFGLNFDALFASLKIMEMLAATGEKISDVRIALPSFYFNAQKIGCPSALKGKMMRKFMEASVGKEASFVDGVKICIDKTNWVLMLPDQHSDYLHLFIQADNDIKGEAILNEFALNIASWMKEE